MWTWIDLNIAALRNNVKLLQNLIGADKTIFILKANAYGHGLKEIYQSLADLKLPLLATNYVSEAVELRSMGYTGRVIVLGPFVPQDMTIAADQHLELFLGHKEGLSAWIASAKKPKLHIEFDTGMSRQGFQVDQAQSVATCLLLFKDKVQGVCMHFANVEDVNEHSYADLQLELFDQAKKHFTDLSFNIEFHAASSASALILESSRFDLARVGISLYGFWPSLPTKISYAQLHGKASLGLVPVLSWKCMITSINEVSAGQYVGYGCTFRARKDLKLGILPVGYYEGYPRIASGSQAYVLIAGQRCPIVGRICMNMMMVDISEVGAVSVGDTATLIGKDGSETIHASDVATWSQTIHYELVTRLSPMIPRGAV